MSYNDWLKLYINYIENNETLCPNCNSTQINVKLAGNSKNMMGFGVIWCQKCMKGIRLSRIKLTENIPYVSFEQAENEFNNLDKIKFIDE